ncbi:MAG: metallophosphoesterase [Bacilli bacterium]|nr:metallophosphoesterase [Bacilli bacterium]
MKNFIVSDLHGNGNIYYSIINYLENLNSDIDEDITLYINGDLIDRGDYSAEMLLDVKSRIENNNSFNIEYLAGNHELMMYQASLSMKDRKWPRLDSWFLYNGGKKTKDKLEELVSLEEELDVIKFISNLKIYHKFKETLNNKNIVLVHAKCPKEVDDICRLRIKDNNMKTYRYLWSRKEDSFVRTLGNENYFTIVGHTQVFNDLGYKYDKLDNVLNIDGGCAGYAYGVKELDHTPLVELDNKNNKLNILTFNNNNEIIYGNYFNEESISMNNNELDKHRKYLKSNSKVKKLTL